MTDSKSTSALVQQTTADDIPALEARLSEMDAELAETKLALAHLVTERDVAQQNVKHALGVLSDERRRLKIILHSIGQGIVVTDAHGAVKMINDIAADYVGLEAKDALGLNLLELLDDELFSRIWAETAEQEQDFAKQPLGIDKGTPRHIWATRARFENERGRIGFVTILQDMTHEREVDRMKTEFVSSVSHELRTPLTSIKGFIATILRDPEMDPQRRIEFLDIADKESDRLIDLIEDLLEISHIEAGRLQLNKSAYRIDDLIDHILPSLQQQISGKRHTLSVLHQAGIPRLAGDRIKLQTAIHNLLTNAIKYTPDGGDIEIRTFKTEAGVRVEIADTGVGIPEEDFENIFTRFYRCASGRHAAPGTGLGLSIVKELVELHGGRIDIESEVGRGSTFGVDLPGTPVPPETASPANDDD